MSRADKFSYWLQALLARVLMGGLGFLPLDAASGFGGFLARLVGPWTGAHKTAARNLRLAFPEKSDAEIAKLLRGMWDNIGRTVAEYPHLTRLADDPERVVIFDPEGLGDRMREDGVGGMLIGMHAANWELSTLPGQRAGVRARHFYRAPNNPYVDEMLARYRAAIGREGFIRKSGLGAREAVKLLKGGGHIGMLVDQKQDEGIAVPFFGRDAMTTTAPAAFARRLNLPIGAARVVRLKGAHFRIFVEELAVEKTADTEADIKVTTRRITAMLERWIREHPEQWFWVHRRWPRG
jgi:KDO2-lipid IV(A) lauroyltransferase